MFSLLVRRLRPTRAFRHVLIAGGTTTALVLESLGWHRLEVVHVWGPGVVTLRPSEAPRFAITTKPGSYPWPVSLRRHFATIDAAAE
ncbi:nucleotide-binding domain containing protein [Oleiharenicola sp. Vm1]|uniref:nucleotide-binding domain containing protein n=1 Tax=Oleiharenicola sp. Vm1 TaxID=3398393 RepID=UPI0039F4FD1D